MQYAYKRRTVLVLIYRILEPKTTSDRYLAIAEIVSILIILNPYRREDMLKNEIVPSSRTFSMLFLF